MSHSDNSHTTENTLLENQSANSVTSHGILAWFANNHVAANLLMISLLMAGAYSLFKIKLEVFPEVSVDIITVTVPYLGASPEEVEEGVCMRVEEAIAGIDNIKELRSTASEGFGMVAAEIEEYADAQKALDDIKAEVDRITTFPKETERPIITEQTTRTEVVSIVLYGDVPEKTLKNLADNVYDELTAKDNISQAELSGVRRNEISIEISEETLRRHGLNFDKVANVIKDCSLDLPGGSVKTVGGEILVRTKGQKYLGEEFEDIIVLTRPDGTKLFLGDITEIIDGFEDSDEMARFDGQYAAMIKVYRVGKQDALDLANTIKEYVEEKRAALPAGVSIATWADRSIILRSRINLLTRNAYLGLILVFVCLTLFLDLRLAFWTTMGIPISFLGAFCLLPFFGVSINMVSLFAFIVVLGIVVDDAIVIGENIFEYRQEGMPFLEAAILGVKELWAPVIIAVLTTIAAFMPLLYIQGNMGKFMRTIPLVVISVLLISLIEALFILPAHLSRGKLRHDNLIARMQSRIRRMMEWFIQNPFAKMLDICIRWRYVTLSLAIALMITVLGFVAGGHIKFVFFPKVDADNIVAMLTMPQGTPSEQTAIVVQQIEEAAREVQQEIDEKRIDDQSSIFTHISTSIGEQSSGRGGGPRGKGPTNSGSHLALVNIELLKGEYRSLCSQRNGGLDLSSPSISKLWRKKVGEIPGVSSLTYRASLFDSGDSINVELSHQDFDTLLQVIQRLKGILAEYDGVSDIADSFLPGKKELKLALNEKGRVLGLTLADLARQVRQGFYGQEVQRIQRGRDDIKVMLRYPKKERESLADIENMRIRLADGTEVPFSTVAQIHLGRGYATIDRTDRRRVVKVTADVDEKTANAKEINHELMTSTLPKLQQEFPGLFFDFHGQERDRQESMGSLWNNFAVALIIIFVLLAIQFRSYIQPLIIMSAIPFGLIGAVIGHLIMGFNLSLLSTFGIVALTGVVVNDSLIMIDLINRQRKKGMKLSEVVRNSATRRFRPIILTTLTTFFGLTPIILEKSLQARFLIPMAVSLGFGVVFATAITLILIPTLYMILEDIKAFGRSI